MGLLKNGRLASICMTASLMALLTGCMVTTPPKSDAPAAATADTVASNPFADIANAPAAAEPHVKPETTTAATDKTPADSQETAPPKDVWQRIRRGMTLSDIHHPRVQQQLAWFKRNPDYMNRVSGRARGYLYYIVEQVEQRHMPMEIALLPVVESAFQPFAYSHGRASGIWQFIPGTARRYGIEINWWYDGRRDIHASTHAALDYLEKLHKDFNGDWLLALAAYNTGEGNVAKAIRRNRRAGKPTDFFSLDLPRETRAYVPRLLAVAAIVRNARQYHIDLDTVPNEAYFRKVDIDGQIDLALAADMAGMKLESLYRLNPGYNQWATSPSGPHYLLLPTDKVAGFKQQLAALPKERRMRWIRHKIRFGDTLGGIARRYHTSVALLRRTNNLSGNTIRAGHSLTVPVASKRLSRYSLSQAERRAATQHTPRQGSKVIYITRKGDTLWDIARSYNVSVKKLARWNAMSPRDTLKEKQKLVIWTKRGKRVASAGKSHLPGAQTIRTVRYTVRRGDSLSRIASRFRVTIAQLRHWNSLPRVGYLQPGQKLKLLVDVTRQFGS
jgi:membrane-bound lytic murein transglycosylase D